MVKNASPSPRITVGLMLVVIAAIHQVVGVLVGIGLDPSVSFPGAPPFVSIVEGGVWNTVGSDPWRASIVWFLLWGFVLALVGLLAHQTERAGLALSRTFAVSLTALCVLGVVLMPASGFWLGFAPAWIAYRRAARPLQVAVVGA